MPGDAEFYDGRRRRLWLSRWEAGEWRDVREHVLIIGLNPSYADEEKPDHTIAVEIGFAKIWGFSALVKVNLFDWVDKNPAVLEVVDNPHGDPRNLAEIVKRAEHAKQIVCAWGDGGALHGRSAFVRTALWPHRRKMFCLGYTKKRYPKHTARLAYSTPLVPMWLGD